MADISKVKVFCIYYKNNYLFETDVLTPIQVSKSFAQSNMNVIQTCTGYNISDKSEYYAELSAWYWVWKNYMPLHKELPYIGFCHYRRFLGYTEPPSHPLYMMAEISLEDFLPKLSLYTSDIIYPQIKDYDVIVPRKQILRDDMKGSAAATVENQYLEWHPREYLDAAKNVIREYYPEYYPTMLRFLNGDGARLCLLFTMRRELLEEFMPWAFDVLFKIENIIGWSRCDNSANVRMPAFLMERLFNVWLDYNQQAHGLKILERRAYFLKIPKELKTEK